MIEFNSFTFSGDAFYEDETRLTFPKGISLLRGINYDAGPSKENSNGAGKTRIPQLLKAFIHNDCDRGKLKQVVLPKFKGRFEFTNTSTKERWDFSANIKENEWEILCNDLVALNHHKFSECQKYLAEQTKLSKSEWSSFVHINHKSITELLQSKDEERRKFFEKFFNIDDFYAEKLAEYKSLVAAQETSIEILEQDRARHAQILDSLSKLPEMSVLQSQIAADSTLSEALKERKSEVAKERLALNVAIADWDQYYLNLESTEGLPSLDELKSAQDSLQRSLLEAEELERRVVTVRSKLNRLPAEREKPTPPSEAYSADTLIGLQQLRMQMEQKQRLIQRFESLKSLLPAKVPGTKEELNTEKEKLLAESADAKLHLSLVGDGSSCSRCGQSLEFVLGSSTPADRHAELQTHERQLSSRISEINRLIAQIERRAEVEKEMASVKTEAMAMPKFARDPQSVLDEIAACRALESAWTAHTTVLRAYEQQSKDREIILAEATALGYPEVLSKPLPNVTGMRTKLSQVEKGITALNLSKSLLERVLKLPPKADLVQDLSETLALEEEIGKQYDALMTALGGYHTQLGMLQGFTKSKEALEVKLANTDNLYNEYKILKALVKFFSPAGFKTYELRRRCEPFVEHANYWSPMFFSELHEWSLSPDPESLEFLVRPVAHPKVKPFPARLLSAGESNRAERVLLFAQLALTPKDKKVNTVFLDEIEGNLDAPGRVLFTEVVIPKLKETFRDKCIVIISHDDSLKNSSSIDHLWLVERRERKSTLKIFENSGGCVLE